MASRGLRVISNTYIDQLYTFILPIVHSFALVVMSVINS